MADADTTQIVQETAERCRGVEVGGSYEDDELPALLADAGCHLAFLTSLFPETFCYTL